MTAIDIIEYQANYSAAAFLMPRVAVLNIFGEIIGQPVANKILQAADYEVSNAIKETAKQFEVNYTAMMYRLQTLGLLEKKSQIEEYIV